MFSNLKYKTKFSLILVVSFIFVILCYQLSIKRTINEYNSLRKNKEIFSEINQLQNLKNLLEKQAIELDGFDSSPDEDYNYQVHLLSSVDRLIKKQSVKIVEIPRMFIEENEDFKRETQFIVFQGDFFELLKLLEKLGYDKTLGNICSVDIYSHQDLKTGQVSVKMKIFFQNINRSETL